MVSFSGTSRGVSVDLSAGYWSYAVPYVGRIMPLGDSITSGSDSPPHAAYRQPLWNLFSQDGVTIDYLGNFQDGPATFPDRDHQGTPGQTADQLLPLVPGLMAQYRPDVVLLMIGSNDVEFEQDLSTLGGEIGRILDAITVQLPATTVFVSTLPPLSAERHGADIPAANAQIRAAVAEAHGEGQHVRLVEPQLSLEDLVDGVHPDTSGNAKIAQAWYDAMIAELPGFGGRRAAIGSAESSITGSEADDRIIGSGASNRLDGGGGHDTVDGKGGSDRLYGRAGGDWLFGGAGSDRLYGDSGNDALHGSTGNDRLYGSSGRDSLNGGPGRDMLEGGTGYDKFVFEARSDSGRTSSKRDVILDFKRGDKVDLSGIDASTKSSGNQKFKLVPEFTGSTRQLEWDKTSKGFVVSGDVNGDGKADFSIQLNTGYSSLRSSDFLL